MVFRNPHRHLSFRHHHSSSPAIPPAFPFLTVCYCLSSWLSSMFKYVNLGFPRPQLLVSCVPLTRSLQQNKQARKDPSRQKGCFVFDLNTYIFFSVKTCDTHQTHTGRLRIRPFPFFLSDMLTLSHMSTFLYSLLLSDSL